jgi:hypothetical protein
MFTLMLSERVTADVVSLVLKPRCDFQIWHPVLHPLVDQLNERAAADVAPSQYWGKVFDVHLFLVAERLIAWVEPSDDDWNNGSDASGQDGLPSVSAKVECPTAKRNELRETCGEE